MKKINIADYLDKPIETINQISDAEINALAYGIKYYSTEFYTGDKQHANNVLKVLNEKIDALKKKVTEAQKEAYIRAAEKAYAQAEQQEAWDKEDY